MGSGSIRLAATFGVLAVGGCAEDEEWFRHFFGAGELEVGDVPRIAYQEDARPPTYGFGAYGLEVREDPSSISPQEMLTEITFEGTGPLRGIRKIGTLRLQFHSQPEVGVPLPIRGSASPAPSEAAVIYFAEEGDTPATSGTVTLETFNFDRRGDDDASIELLASFDNVILGDINGVPPYTLEGRVAMSGTDRGNVGGGEDQTEPDSPNNGGDSGAGSGGGGDGGDSGSTGLPGIEGLWVHVYPGSTVINEQPAFSGFDQQLISIDPGGSASWCTVYWRPPASDRAECFDSGIVGLTFLPDGTLMSDHTEQVYTAADCVFAQAWPITSADSSWSLNGDTLSVTALIPGTEEVFLDFEMRRATAADEGGCTNPEMGDCRGAYAACMVSP